MPTIKYGRNSMKTLNERFGRYGISVKRENGKYVITGDDGKVRTAWNLSDAAGMCKLAYQYGFSRRN